MPTLHHLKLPNGINFYHIPTSNHDGKLVHFTIFVDFAPPYNSFDKGVYYFLKQYLIKASDTSLDVDLRISNFFDNPFFLTFSEEETKDVAQRMTDIFTGTLNNKELTDVKKLAEADLEYRLTLGAIWPYSQKEYTYDEAFVKEFKKTDIKKLLERMKEILVGKNIKVVVTGGIIDDLKEILKGIPVGKKYEALPFSPPKTSLDKRIYFVDHPDTTMTEISYGFSFVLDINDQAVLAVVGALFTLYFEKKLKHSFFLKNSNYAMKYPLFYSGSTSYVHINIYMNMEEAKKEVGHILEHFRTITISPEEFKKASKLATYVFDHKFSDITTKHHILLALEDNGTIDVNQKRDLIKSVTSQQVIDFINKYITNDNMSIVFYGAIPFQRAMDVVQKIKN
jgi:hypothetical protein